MQVLNPHSAFYADQYKQCYVATDCTARRGEADLAVEAFHDDEAREVPLADCSGPLAGETQETVVIAT